MDNLDFEVGLHQRTTRTTLDQRNTRTWAIVDKLRALGEVQASDHIRDLQIDYNRLRIELTLAREAIASACADLEEARARMQGYAEGWKRVENLGEGA